MNKQITALAAVTLLLFLVLSAGCITEKNVYTIGVSSALEPFSSKNVVTGEPYGIDIDIINWIANDQGFDVTYTYVLTSEFLDKLNAGTLDVVSGKVITEERLKRCDFTDVYYTAKYGLVVRKDSGITVDDVLNGQAAIAVNAGSSYESWLKSHYGADTFAAMVADEKIILKPSVNAVVYSVLSKEADSGMTSGGSLSQMLDEYTPLKFAGYVSEGNNAGFAVAKTNPELLNLLNKGLRNMKASGEYNRVMEEHGIPHLKSVYTVGTDTNRYPWSYLDENGNHTGFDVEVLRWIGDRNGFDVTFQDVLWSKSINSIVTGNIDIFAAGMTITPERLEKAAFSDPYFSEGTAVFSLSKNPVSKTDLETGKVSVGFIRGTTHENFLRNLLGSEQYDTLFRNGGIHLYDSQADLEKGLSSGQVDTIVQSNVSEPYNRDTSRVTLTALYPDTGKLAYAMGNGDIELQDAVNKGLAALESSGKRAELLAEYGLD